MRPFFYPISISHKRVYPIIKDCATLATWLGNDETHYVRLWEDKDMTDLKALIKLTRNWIITHIQTEKYISDMKPSDKGEKDLVL